MAPHHGRVCSGHVACRGWRSLCLCHCAGAAVCRTFASGIFFRGFITYCIYLASFCISTALYIKGHDKLPGDSDATGYDHVRFVFDMITLLLTAYATVSGCYALRAWALQPPPPPPPPAVP